MVQVDAFTKLSILYIRAMCLLHLFINTWIMLHMIQIFQMELNYSFKNHAKILFIIVHISETDSHPMRLFLILNKITLNRQN
jgi:hypothetical protein